MMKKKMLLLLTGVLIGLSTLSAQVSKTIDVSIPGTLSQLIGDEKNVITDLIVTGTIDDTDFGVFKQMKALKNLNLQQLSNTTIPFRTFFNMTLNEVILPSELQVIGERAFEGSNIKVTIPESVLSFEKYAFLNAKLNLVDFSKCKNVKSIGGCVFQNTTDTIDLTPFTSLSYIGGGCFGQSTAKVILPKHLTSTFESDFSGFKGEVVLPEGLLNIDSHSFANTQMKKLILPSSLQLIGKSAFSNSIIDSVDFSQCKNVKIIGMEAFYGVKGIIDLTPFTSLSHIGGRCFGQSTAKVILPKHLTSTFESDFSGFKGEVVLPEGLLNIGMYSFANNTQMKKLTLPTGLQAIDKGAFANSIIDSIDFSQCKNVKTISTHAFYGIKGIIDLTPFTSLSRIGGQCFKYSTAKVILPKHLKIIQSGSFSGFTGEVTLHEGIIQIEDAAFMSVTQANICLPKTLQSIGEDAFRYAKIKRVIIPDSLTKIAAKAFMDCTELVEIVSLNPTPPQLGANVFANVNKQTCTLKVPKASYNLYATANQWKDFLNIVAYIPETIPLTMRLHLNPYGGDASDMYSQNEGKLIGEYYWSDVFTMDVPSFNWWATPEFPQSLFPVNADYFGMYLKQIHIDYATYNPSREDFNKYYGVYYDSFSTTYFNSWMVMGDTSDSTIYQKYEFPPEVWEGQKKTGWLSPNLRDYRQLAAMCPFFTNNSTSLSELDVRIALSCKPGDNPLAYNIDNGTSKKVYWFEDMNTNMYGFNLMPGGVRLHAENANWSNGLYNEKNVLEGTPYEHMSKRNVITGTDANGNQYKFDDWTGPRGAFATLFYTAQYRANDGQFILHDRIDTGTPNQWSWMNLRWRRKLTDEELGYKIFVKVNNIDKSSFEWTEFANNQNEIPILKEVKKGNLSTSDFNIVKINDPKAIAPAEYVELPNGYIRGFYVQYFISNPNSGRTIDDVIMYAYNVKDNALDIPKSNSNTSKSQKRMDNIRSQIQSDLVVNIYPNPASDVLNIECPDNILNIEIYNSSGSLVSKINTGNSAINISELPTGLYIIKISTESKTYMERIMKK
ncbi:MAG: leucine-rich repeat protein [Dysgonomonas sp.]